MPKKKKKTATPQPKTFRCVFCAKRVRAASHVRHLLSCSTLEALKKIVATEQLALGKASNQPSSVFARLCEPSLLLQQERGSVALIQDGVYRSHPVVEGRRDDDPFRAGRKKYDLIFADPPWEYRRKSGRGIVPYSTMSFEEIWGLPVRKLAAPDAILVLCIVSPSAIQCLETFKWWGFEMKTKLFDWIKMSAMQKFLIGTGCYTRPSSEDTFIGTRGGGFKWVVSHSTRQVIFAERTGHSAKPEAYFKGMREFFGDNYDKMKKIELFARAPREGWDTWGNQLNPF